MKYEDGVVTIAEGDVFCVNGRWFRKTETGTLVFATLCAPPDEIKKALELVEAVREQDNRGEALFNERAPVYSARLVAAVAAVRQPTPPPEPSEAEEIATRLISRTDALVRKAGGTLYSRQMTAALHAIAEEIAAAKGGKP